MEILHFTINFDITVDFDLDGVWSVGWLVFNSLETRWCGLRRWCDSSGAGGSHGHPVFGLGPRHWRAVSSIGEDSSIYHLDFLFLYPIEVRPMDRGRTGASFVARFSTKAWGRDSRGR